MRTLLPALLLLAAACGGSVEAPFGQSSGSGSGASGATGNASATAASGEVSSAASGVTGAGGASVSVGVTGAGGASMDCTIAAGDCKTQIQDLRMKLGAAKACDPNGVNQCQGTIQGPCCLEPVNDPGSFESECFLDSLAAATCKPDCLDPCPAIQGVCVEKDGKAHCF